MGQICSNTKIFSVCVTRTEDRAVSEGLKSNNNKDNSNRILIKNACVSKVKIRVRLDPVMGLRVVM